METIKNHLQKLNTLTSSSSSSPSHLVDLSFGTTIGASKLSSSEIAYGQLRTETWATKPKQSSTPNIYVII